MALTIALLGWLFDGYEMGLFPLIGGPALASLLGPAAAADAPKWFGAIMAMFLVGAATGGVLFGWLGDRLGRKRAIALSIVTYAVFTGLCGLAVQVWHVAALRFVASLGMGGEWSLGVALVNEIWPGKSRAVIAGLIGAAANAGILAVGVLSIGLHTFIGSVETFLLAVRMPQTWVSFLLADSGWRFLMISGAFPAILVFLVIPFVPESRRWENEKARGATSHWANDDLYGILIGCVASLVIVWSWSPIGVRPAAAALITVIGLAVALAGFLLPARRYLDRAAAAGAILPGAKRQILKYMLLGAGLAGVVQLGTWGSIQWAAFWAFQMEPNPARLAKEYTQVMLSVSAIVGTLIAAFAAARYGRRITYAVMCAGSIVSALLLYQANHQFDGFFLFCAFLAGGMSASFYGWFPLYLPELFPTAVRATGQGFAYNFGRILAAVGGLQTAALMALFGGSFPKAGSVLTLFYFVGLVIIWLGPETRGKPLPS
jgi:MFS family permease